MPEAKIFVGGLSWETTTESLREYFQSFGEVTDVELKTDMNTGKSRGFGFVTFSDSSSVSQVISTQNHSLDGKTIDPKVAKAKGGREPVLKVFVGGVDPELTEEEIRQHFGQYGAIDDVDLPFDKIKQQRRPFCFVKFQSEDVVNNVVADPKQILGGKEVDVKKATPKNDQGNGFGGYGAGAGGRGGYGGGYGGGGYGGARGGASGGRGGRGGRGGYGAQSYGGGYGSQSYGGGYYGNGNSSYGGGYDSSYGGSRGSYGYGGGDEGYGGYGQSSAAAWGGQGAQKGGSGYHPYQR